LRKGGDLKGKIMGKVAFNAPFLVWKKGKESGGKLDQDSKRGKGEGRWP